MRITDFKQGQRVTLYPDAKRKLPERFGTVIYVGRKVIEVRVDDDAIIRRLSPSAVYAIYETTAPRWPLFGATPRKWS